MNITTPCICGENNEFVVKSLEQSVSFPFNWLQNNQMKVNEDKCHVLLSIDETMQVNIDTAHKNNTKCEKL